MRSAFLRRSDPGLPGRESAIRRILLVAAVACGGGAGAQGVEPPAAADVVEPVAGTVLAGIPRAVEDLGYPPDVGEAFAAFAAGMPLPRLPPRPTPAREQEAIDVLGRHLSARVRQESSPTRSWSLPEVIRERRAQCLGMVQLWYVLGTAMGLDVAAVEVSRPAEGELAEHETHVAPLVRLVDGRVRIIDARFGLDSGAFRLAEAYHRDGAMWTRSALASRSRLHRRIRLLDPDGIEAAIMLNTGNTYRRAGREDEAAEIYVRGLDLDRLAPTLHLAVAETALLAGRWDDAERSIRTALEIDAECSGAHAALGGLLMRENRWPEAVAAFDRALALNPRSPDAIRQRREAVARGGAGRPPATTTEPAGQ